MDILLSLKNMIAPQVSGPMSLSQFEDYDVQCPAFFRTTDEERDQLLDHVRQNPYVEKADVTGRGFLSVRLKPDVFGALDFTAETQDPKTYVVDYGGMNVAKRLHIGHIRSMFIGDSICRLLKNQGHKVIPQNHLGDWGNQFGPLLEQMLEKHPDLTLWTGDLLTEAYRESVLRAKEDPEFSERANNRAVLLQQKTDGLTIKAWEQAVSLSMEENNEWFTRFGLLLTQEDTAGESSYADHVQGVISGLVEKGLAEENADGSVVAHFSKLSPLVLRKQTGAALYAAFDLAAVLHRKNEFCPDAVFYVVDKRQALHFQQVFDLAERAGWMPKNTLNHVAFGTILGKDKKPLKTRSGDTLFLDDLLRDGFLQYEQSVVGQKNAGSPAAESIKNASVIGALKYYDLHLTPEDNYVFDWDFVLATQGQSAPYIQNAVVRIDSVLAKNDNRLFSDMSSPPLSNQEFHEKLSGALKSVNWTGLSGEAKHLAMATLTATHAFSGTKPHDVVAGLMRVARSMHAFYENTPVLGSARENDYLALLHATGLTLFFGCSLLGVETFPSLANTKTPKPARAP